jgi:hypothetical protein
MSLRSGPRPKSVLLISYFFPPMPGAGPLRPGRLAKLLPRFGWSPTTLTGPWHGAGSEFGEVVTLEALGDPVAAQIRGLHRIASTPARWGLGATRAALALAGRRDFEAVVSISNPVFNHMVAAITARQFGLPWLADYSEAWTGNAFAPKSALATKVNRLVETRTLRGATAMTCATPGIRGILTKLHARSDIEVIENAVDLSEWDDIPSVAPASFTLLFAGMLWGGRLTPDILFAAVARLREMGHPAGTAARFEFYCHEHELVAEAARRVGICDAVTLHPISLRDRVLRAERRAAALVILFPMRPISVVPSKLYEFYGARRPILAVGPEQSKAQLGGVIEGNRLGYFATDESECAAAICTLYERFLAGQYDTDPNPDWMPPTAEAAAQRLASVLDRITGTPRSHDAPTLREEAHA